MKTVARAIIKARFFIYIIFAAMCVFCVLSVGKVRVNNDLKAFLPEETETRRGIAAMADDFKTYASTSYMVCDIPFDEASSLAEKIGGIDGVMSVSFDDSSAHYAEGSALFSVSFSAEAGDKSAENASELVEKELEGYKIYKYSELSNSYADTLAGEMVWVFLFAVIAIVSVLLLTSESYFEVVIYFAVFAVSALLNMGTNYLLGEISEITNTVAVILQLALAIDYAIILSHRYQLEAERFGSGRTALIEALSKAIVEIASSSLTTVAGLLALTLMQFRLGYDLGVVLSKGIICSLLTVFLLMPCLILLFPKLLEKTKHRSFVPDITVWGRFTVRARYVIVIVFLLIIPVSIFFSSKTEYAFSDSSVTEIIHSDSREAMHKIDETFETSTPIAVLVPAGDVEAERSLLAGLSKLEGINSSMGLASIDVGNGTYLTDSYTPAMLADLAGIDEDTAKKAFFLYALKNGSSSVPESAPLDELLMCIFDGVDISSFGLDEEKEATFESLKVQVTAAVEQLKGKKYSRLVLTADVPVEGDESTALLEKIRSECDAVYGEGKSILVGNITCAADLSSSFNGDSAKVSILTTLFVFIILLVTFRSVIGSLALVFVIQGSIWINFSLSYIGGSRASFVTYMIVSAIQMGATIDYAIVLMSHYRALKEDNTPKKAMAKAVSESFSTVITSGLIMTAAGLLIAFMISDVYVGHIGLAVGRGALISSILVLTVLPALITLLDKLIDKTTFFKKKSDNRLS